MSTGVDELHRSAPQYPHSAPPRKARGPLTGVLWVVLALAIGGGGFAAGRLTAPDEKTASAAPNGDSGSAASVSQLLSQALQLHTGGDLDGASALYDQILDKDPQNKYALFNLGQIAQTRGQFDLAIEKYQAAIAVDPKYGPALYNAGLAYASKGDRAHAIQMLRQALEVSPDSATAMFNLGTQLVADGKNAEGTALIERAIEKDPSLRPKN
jgi:tetratricopeptide (TPR) repeat protein